MMHCRIRKADGNIFAHVIGQIKIL